MLSPNVPQTEEEKRQLKGFTLFGHEIRAHNDDPADAKVMSFVPPHEETESAIITTAGGFTGQTLDVRGDQFQSERDLIVKYRNAAMHPETDRAIEEIISEAIVANDNDMPITLNLDHTDLSDGVKKKIVDEFEKIMRLMNFRKNGHEIFRRWYIDARLAYHIVIDLNNPKRGIQEIRPINPLKIQKVKEVVEEQDARTGAKLISGWDEYFIYSDDGFTGSSSSQGGGSMGMGQGGGGSAVNGLKIAKDSVAYITSGIMDQTRRYNLSYLHKSLRAINQLRMMEDSLVIYRLARAPERRIFSVDVSDMSKVAGQQYMSQLMAKYRNKLTYDAATGDVTSDRKHMHMLEDFWLPRTSTGGGAQVSNLPGGTNLGEIEDILYFKKQLLNSMNVPMSRLDNESGFSLGRSTEINRDEVKFQKFIDQLRTKFAELFKQLLRNQLILTGILTSEEWEDLGEEIMFDYARDNFFSELKEAEILRERIQTLNEAKEHQGTYFSKEYIRRHILHQSEEQIKEIKHQIRGEALNNDGLPNPDDADLEGGGGPGPEGGGFEGDLGDPGMGEDLPDENEVPLDDPEGAATELGADAETDTDLGEEEETR